MIGSGKFEIDSPFVVGNVQTLYRNIDKITKEFGTIILDEMHHVSSPTFSKVIDTNYCRYKLGLSGTIERTSFLDFLSLCFRCISLVAIKVCILFFGAGLIAS